MKNLYKKLLSMVLVSLVIVPCFPKSAAAADFSTSMSPSSTTISKGGSFTVTLSFSSDVNVAGIAGTLSYDTSKLSITSSSSAGGFSTTVGASGLSATSTSGATSSNFATITFSATSSFAAGESLTVSFNVSSGSNEDGSVLLSGSGCSCTVSIPGQATTEPTDPPTSQNKPQATLSADATLASLSVNGAELSPKFNSATTEYEVSVDYAVSKLDITAKPKNSKSSVKIENNTLTPGGQTAVSIIVTAENGASSTYVINAKRMQDPNYVPAKDCTLTALTVSEGELSPSFNPETYNYIVQLNAGIKQISFDPTPRSPLATCNTLGESQIIAGRENMYHIVCTAEDGVSTKIYNVTVISAQSYDTFISKSYIDSIKKQINAGNSPVVMDMSSAAVQIVSADIFETLSKQENSQLILITKNGTFCFDSAEMVYEISQDYYDLSLIKSSSYSDNILPSLASYENFTFSTPYKGDLPGFATIAVYTDMAKGSSVNVYMYDESDDSYIIAAKGVIVENGGVVAFDIDKGGDFVITTKDILNANEYHSLNRVSNKNDIGRFIAYAAVALLFVLLGFVLGYFIRRGKKSLPKKQSEKVVEKAEVKPSELETENAVEEPEIEVEKKKSKKPSKKSEKTIFDDEETTSFEEMLDKINHDK